MISKALKMADITCLQIFMLSFGPELGPDMLLALSIDRFGVERVLEDDNMFQVEPPADDAYPSERRAYIEQRNLLEYQGPLLAGLLKTLIDVVIALPTTLLPRSSKYHPGSDSADSIESALSREVVNTVLSGATTLGQLQIVKNMVGGDKTITETLTNKVVELVCTKREARQEGEKSTLQLRPEAYRYFDPEFAHMTQEQLNNSVDQVRERMTQERKSAAVEKDSAGKSSNWQEETDTPRPLMSAVCLPDAQISFEEARGLLFRPLMNNLISRCVSLVMAKPCHMGLSGGPAPRF